MPSPLIAFVAAGILVLVIIWVVILARALSSKAGADYFFFGNKPPKDPE